MARLPVFALLLTLIACTKSEPAGPEAEQIESLLGGKERARRCTVEPDPPVSSQRFTVSAQGLSPSVPLRVWIRRGELDRVQDGRTNPSGKASVTQTLTSPEPVEVAFFEVDDDVLSLGAWCSFDVLNASDCATTCGAAFECGTIDDGCGRSLDCGGCPRGERCGILRPNRCDCDPTTCNAAGADCGMIDNGCGGMADCGGCRIGEVCGARAANQCDPPCTNVSCMSEGAVCGTMDNGCGALLNCGTCPDEVESPCNVALANQCGWPAAYTTLEDQLLELLNQQRMVGADCGGVMYPPAPLLTMRPNLRKAARLHAKDNLDRMQLDHTGADGSTLQVRLERVGYGGTCPCAENLARGYDTAAETHRQLIESPQHCQNIMNPEFRFAGIGFAESEHPISDEEYYWTQIFAR